MCTWQAKCKRSASSFLALFSYMSSLTNYIYIFGQEGHADTQKRLQRKYFWKLNTHVHSAKYSSRKAITVVFRELCNWKNQFCRVFFNYCNKTGICCLSYASVCTLYQESADPVRSTGRQASWALELPSTAKASADDSCHWTQARIPNSRSGTLKN